MKKLMALLLAVVLVCSFAACGGGKDDGTYEIALVTDVGNIDDKSFNEGAWNGVKEYAEANKISYNYYRPSEDSTAARVETIGTAIEKGAKVVVCPGYLFEEAIYQVQDLYPEVQFLLLDGEPHDADYNYKTAANVHCILYQEEWAGFFAGYAAVADGYTKLGFMGGMDVPAVIRFGYGFVQGAEYAGKVLGLAEGAIEINYTYVGSFAPSDDIKVKADGWYTAGTEVIFSCGGGIYQSIVAAADATENCKVIGVDVDQSAESERIITSAMKNLTGSVKLALTDLYANNGKWTDADAGKTAILGIKEDCVGIPTAEGSWRLNKFTVDEYKVLYEMAVNGEVSVSNDTMTVPATTIVKLNVQ